MEALSFDTTFLIDFQRERRKTPGAATRFLEAHRESPAYLSVVAIGEFAEGFVSRSDPVFLSVVESFEVLDVNRRVAAAYARITRSLRRNGNLIGTNDLWIAAVSVAHSLPLVTRNAEHFSRIADLKVVAYG